MSPRNAGEGLLLRLKQLGVDYFFANPGTEFVSIIRGFHDLPRDSVPVPVLAPHEFQAVCMAYGYYLATQRPQAVMTHANVGAANALIGLIGAARMNIPLIFISGMTSQSERETPGSRDKLIHWSQDTKDQGAIFREYVKWEAEVRDVSSLYDVLDRAHAISTSHPCGPVAIKISRDVLVNDKIQPPPSRPAVVSHSSAGPSPEAMAQVQKWLESSRRPLIVTNRLGADPAAVSRLQRLSEKWAVGVLTPEDYYASFPAGHPHHLGYQIRESLSEADLVLVLESDVPWYPLNQGPADTAKVVHVGADPLFQNIPLRSHRGDLFVQSSASAFLAGLMESPANDELLQNRRSWLEVQRPKFSRRPLGGKLTAESVSYVLSEFLDQDTVLLNELGLVPSALNVQHPGTYFRSGSASPLGWGVGCALGIGLAGRKKTLIAAVGDGVFYLSPVLPSLALAMQMETPFLLLVLNNGAMSSIAGTTRGFYRELPSQLPLTQFAAGMQFEKCADLVGGLGLRAETVSELRESIHRGLEFLKQQKRSVVLNAVTE